MASKGEIDTAAFLVALKLRALTVADCADPLALASSLIHRDPDTAESRGLRKLLQTLVSTRGVFRESEAWLFSGEMSGLTAAMSVNAHSEALRFTP
jgi:hypothetical protein